ncbi:hypothetical protein CK203_058335 [Vitis vinifera]|uniref:Uncharacterized protein n=1 Tax=Vitis vinifera TaxID=29760 RepID=A0A438GE15_VITVI|nr:hypothetical protein CK203_058335 [Vitis vinifera]
MLFFTSGGDDGGNGDERRCRSTRSWSKLQRLRAGASRALVRCARAAVSPSWEPSHHQLHCSSRQQGWPPSSSAWHPCPSPSARLMQLEFEYGCGPSSALVAMTYECRADEDEDEEECESQEGDDQSERAEDIQHDGDRVFEVIDEENNNVNVVSSFLALHEAMEGEQGRYVSVDREGCDMSNKPDHEDPIEFSPVQYHSAPSLQFENVENIGNAVSSDWTPWGNTNIGNSGGEFMVGQVLIQKQIYNMLRSCTLLVHIKSTTSFAINKYNGPHKCVNPCLNPNYQQLDSNLIAAHIQGMIKAQFTLSVAAIQASIVEKFGYQISYKKASKAKLKALTNLFGDFYKSYAELPHFFIALEQANPGCVVISKTFLVKICSSSVDVACFRTVVIPPIFPKNFLSSLKLWVLGIIQLTLSCNVAFNIAKKNTTTGLMVALSDMYEKPSASNKVHLMRRLFNL